MRCNYCTINVFYSCQHRRMDNVFFGGHNRFCPTNFSPITVKLPHGVNFCGARAPPSPPRPVRLWLPVDKGNEATSAILLAILLTILHDPRSLTFCNGLNYTPKPLNYWTPELLVSPFQQVFAIGLGNWILAIASYG